MTTYISNSDHYKEVLSRVLHVKESLWIGTADIKDLYIEDGKIKKPFLEGLAKLIKKGVAVRLIHAKEPGPNFREDFDRFPILYDGLERVLNLYELYRLVSFHRARTDRLFTINSRTIYY